MQPLYVCPRPLLGAAPWDHASPHGLCRMLFLLSAVPPVLGSPLLQTPLLFFCYFLLNNPPEPPLAPPGMGAALPPLTHFFPAFSPPDNRCVQSRAKSCSECIRVDKECSFCTEEVRPGRGHWGSASRLVSCPASHHHWAKPRKGTQERSQLPAPASPDQKLTDMDFPWLRHWQAGRRESLGQTSRIQGFIRKCLLARPAALRGEECPRDGGRVLSQTAQ